MLYPTELLRRIELFQTTPKVIELESLLSFFQGGCCNITLGGDCSIQLSYWGIYTGYCTHFLPWCQPKKGSTPENKRKNTVFLFTEQRFSNIIAQPEQKCKCYFSFFSYFSMVFGLTGSQTWARIKEVFL